MSTPGPTRDPGDLHILVVEDDWLIAELITMMVEQAGYKTTHARDGVDGLEKLQAQRFDAVLLDMGMPRLDGCGVLRAVGEIGGDIARVPIMVLSGRGSGPEIDEALRLGARSILTKPIEGNRLIASVDEVFGIERAEALFG